MLFHRDDLTLGAWQLPTHPTLLLRVLEGQKMFLQISSLFLTEIT